MKIEVLVVDNCPSYPLALDLLYRVLREEGLSVPIDVLRMSSHEDAVRTRFLGSPTIQINGEDVEGGARARQDFGLKCRLYTVDGRLVGVPDERMFRESIRAAKLQRSVSETGQRCKRIGR